MAQRDRTAFTTIDGGIRWQSGAPISSVQITNDRGTCTDFTDPGDCRPLTISKWSFEGGILNHPLDAAGTGFSNYVCDMLRSTGVPGPHLLNVTGVPSDTAAATSAAAQTNPSRPYVDIPVDLLQIGELLQLIQRQGYTLIKEAARENLRFQFGIYPTVDDVVKLIARFHDQVDRRVREVKRLQTKKGLRRTVTAGQSSYAGSDLWVPQSNGIFVSTRAHGLTEFTKRVHCRWLPTADLSKLYTPAEMRRLIQRAVLGATVDFSTVWQIIPWSWLIDWGFTLGTYLKSQRNIIPAQLTTCVVMLRTRTAWECPGVSGSNNGKPTTMDPIRILRQSMTRTSVSPSVTAQFPFLNGNQVGILASLVAAKARMPSSLKNLQRELR
jgi:hypothetical protein